eukprot:352178-Chlamydomonas_euryale.AAC.13
MTCAGSSCRRLAHAHMRRTPKCVASPLTNLRMPCVRWPAERMQCDAPPSSARPVRPRRCCGVSGQGVLQVWSSVSGASQGLECRPRQSAVAVASGSFLRARPPARPRNGGLCDRFRRS